MCGVFLAALAGVLMLLCVSSARAQGNPLEWQQEAIRQFPDLAKQESALNRLFASEVKRLRSADAQFFSNPQWPVVLAKECAAKLVPPGAPAPVAVKGNGNVPAPPAKEIKFECAYVELSARQADQIEALLSNWNKNPAATAAAVQGLVWGAGVTKIANAVATGEPGKRAIYRKTYRKATVPPVGMAANKWTGEVMPEEDTLEVEGTIGTAGEVCDAQFQFFSRRLHAHSYVTFKTNQNMFFYNAIPVVVARRDFGSTARVVVARATWRPGNIATLPTDGSAPVASGVRAQAFWVPPAFTDQAVQLAGEPVELMNFLRKRGVSLGSSYGASKSGQRSLFVNDEMTPVEMTKEKASYVPKMLDGVYFEGDPVLGAKPGEMTCIGTLHFTLRDKPPNSPPELLHTRFVAEGDTGKIGKTGSLAGAFACFRLDEAAGNEKVKRSDVYVVFEGIDPRAR